MRTRDKEDTKRRLRRAVGEVLAEDGFEALGLNRVAQRAGVDKVLVYRYFDDLPGLVLSYCQTVDFWPGTDELVGPDPEAVARLSAAEQMSYVFKSLIRALRRRPQTIKILAWRQAEDNVLARQIDDIQMRSALEFFDRLDSIPTDRDLTALVLILGAAVFALLSRSVTQKTAGGVDLTSDFGWRRIEKGIDQLVLGTWLR